MTKRMIIERRTMGKFNGLDTKENDRWLGERREWLTIMNDNWCGEWWRSWLLMIKRIINDNGEMNINDKVNYMERENNDSWLRNIDSENGYWWKREGSLTNVWR